MVAAGFSLPSAIKDSIDGSQTAFAARNGLIPQYTNEIINLARVPDRRTCDALARELGGSSYEWALLLWEHARPEEASFTNLPGAEAVA